jgi:hypothetical protein
MSARMEEHHTATDSIYRASAFLEEVPVRLHCQSSLYSRQFFVGYQGSHPAKGSEQLSACQEQRK